MNQHQTQCDGANAVGPTEIQPAKVTGLVNCKSFQELQSPGLKPWAASWTHNLNSKAEK
jgi:hypothetical protein